MKRLLVLRCFGLSLGLAVLSGCARQKPIIVQINTTRTAELKMPQDIAGKSPDGKPIKLSDYRGKVVLVDFWATTCSPCVRQIPHIAAAYRKYHAQGFDVLGVSMDDDMPKLRRYIQVKKMPWNQITDPSGKLTNSIVPDGHGIPLTALIGRDGSLVAADLSKDDLSSAIERALAKKA